MKKTIIATCIVLCSCIAYAQLPTVVSGNLVLHLDAANGFTDAVGSTPAIWLDQSGNGNNMTGTPMPSLQPTLVTFTPKNGWAGSSFPAVQIHSDPYTSPASGHMVNSGPTNNLNGTDMTIIVVATRSSNSLYPTFISLYQTANTPDNGFTLQDRRSIHYTDANNYSYIVSSCFPVYDRPAVFASRFGSAVSDIDVANNGVPATGSITTVSSPAPLTGAARNILIGGLYNSSNVLDGLNLLYADVFEILVYDGKLSNTDLTTLTDYMRCKYEIFYDNCNTTPLPSPCAKGSSSGCVETPYFVLNYIGDDGNGNCIAEIDFRGTPVPGVTFSGYELTVPGSAPVILPPSTSFPYSFVVNSPVIGMVKLEIIGSNGGSQPGTVPCCSYVMTQQVKCDYVPPGPPVWQGMKTSVDSINGNSDNIQIYPNPAYDKIYMRSEDEKTRTIILTDMVGKEIKRITSKDKLVPITLQALAKGMYLIQVTDYNGTTIKQTKVVVQ